MELFDVRVDAIAEDRAKYLARFIAQCEDPSEPFVLRRQRAERALAKLPNVVLRGVTPPSTQWLATRLKNVGATFEIMPGGERMLVIDPHGDRMIEIIERKPSDTKESFEDTIRARRAAGWIVVERERDAIVKTSAINRELERQLADQGTIESLHVYADWLLEQGDVRGELMSIALRLLDPGLSAQERPQLEERELEIHRVHQRRLVGRLGSSPYLQLRWRAGVIDAVQLDYYGQADAPTLERELLDELIADLLALPTARLLRSFVCRNHDLAGLTKLLTTLGPPQSLRSLVLGPKGGFDGRTGPSVGMIPPLLQQLPNLEELELTSLDFDFADLEMAKLKRLHLVGSVVDTTLQQLASASWPALETIELLLQTSSEYWVPTFPPSMEGFRPLLDADLPALQRLTIRGAPQALSHLATRTKHGPRMSLE